MFSKARKTTFIILFFILTLIPVYSYAMPEYASRTGAGCKTCHVKAEGGALTTRGLQYAASGYKWPPQGGYKVLGPMGKFVRLLTGFFHVVAAFIWFGTILYVHIILRPAYASRGLPKGEAALGIVSMAVVGVTGILLVVSRIRSIDVFYKSLWGVLLSVKIALYLVMVLSALVVIVFVGPRLRKGVKRASLPQDGVFDPVTLSGFDGKEGTPAYIAYKGKVYDVSGLKLWKGGLHMRHRSGEDLTTALPKAPHGEEKLETLKVVGSYDASLKPPRSPAQKAFYFIAYMNLALVFAVLFVISFWRWGI